MYSALLFQSLLHQPIDQLEISGVSPEQMSETSYWLDPEEINSIYELPYGRIYLSTDHNGLIEEIKLNLYGIPDEVFFKGMNHNFGKPKNVKIIEEVNLISEGYNTKDGISSYFKNSSIKTREGSLDENPIYVIWQTESSQIDLLIKREEGTCQLMFKIPSKAKLKQD